jgi:phenylacetate-CoA ligase
MTIAGKIRALSMMPEILRRVEFYSRVHTREEQLEIQLGRFNHVWQEIIENVPYYRDSVTAGLLPREFRDWNQFRETMPITARRDLQQDQTGRKDPRKKVDFFRESSGSTSEPLRLPAWNSERRFTRPNMWVGRDWNGIDSQERCYYFWGMQGVLKNGLSKEKERFVRKLKDRLLGYRRAWPYDLVSDADYKKVAKELLEFHPTYLVGYATDIEQFAFANRSRASTFHKLKIKGAVVSAEGFNSPASAKVIEEVLNCPVIQEYGCVEADVIAYTDRSGQYSVFWHDHFLEVVNIGDGQTELLVTSLYPRCTPLIRYRIGDEIDLFDQDAGLRYGVTRFKDIRGRTTDFLQMPDGQRIDTHLFRYVMLNFTGFVNRLQILPSQEGIVIDVLSPLESIPEDVINEIRHELEKVHPLLLNVEIRVVKQFHQTTNGKIPYVWISNSDASTGFEPVYIND